MVVVAHGHRWEVGGDWWGAAEIRLVRLGGGRQVGHERRHASGRIRDRGHKVRGDDRSRNRSRSEGLWVERCALCGGARRATLSRSARFVRGGIGAPVAFGQGAGVGEDDYGGAVVNGGRVGEVCLAEARRRGEVYTMTEG